ncbi:MAG: MFS transporter small subunit [Solirubrobacteraceae bacterium]
MDQDTSRRGGEIRGMALWVIVGAGLLYGVVNTARQVVDLFGG